MTITELATLKLSQPHNTLTHKLKKTSLQASAAQAAWSSHPVYFFADRDNNEDQRIVYLIAGWESVSAHYEWIKSDENQKWMKELGQWFGEVGLKHLDFPFEKEALDVGCVVYSQRGTKGERDGAEETGEKGGWSATGKDLEDVESGYHGLTTYPHVLFSDVLKEIGEPVEGERRTVLKRIWASNDREGEGAV